MARARWSPRTVTSCRATAALSRFSRRTAISESAPMARSQHRPAALVGKLRIVNFANQLALQKMGTSLYDAAGQQPTPVTSPHVHQGMLEKSNVQPVIEITHMIEVMRAYQACVELTQSGEDLLKQAIDKIGAVPQEPLVGGGRPLK